MATLGDDEFIRSPLSIDKRALCTSLLRYLLRLGAVTAADMRSICIQIRLLSTFPSLGRRACLLNQRDLPAITSETLALQARWMAALDALRTLASVLGLRDIVPLPWEVFDGRLLHITRVGWSGTRAEELLQPYLQSGWDMTEMNDTEGHETECGEKERREAAKARRTLLRLIDMALRSERERMGQERTWNMNMGRCGGSEGHFMPDAENEEKTP